MTTAPEIDPFGADTAEGAAFFNSGNTAAKFPKDGFTVTGTVLGWQMRQQTHIDSREPLWLYNGASVEESKIPEANGVRARITGNPRNRVMQMVIDLQCEPTFETYETNQYLRKELPEDDGVRSLFVKGQMKAVIGKEIQKAGHRVPEIGALLEVKRLRAERVGDGGKFTKFVFAARYTVAAQNPNAAAVGAGVEDDPFGGFE